MFNWYGNHKIGFWGTANSGKTIFITSLLWHLPEHNPEKFKFGKNITIKDFKIIEHKDHDFKFEKHKNAFIRQHSWLDKTADYSITSCKSECWKRSVLCDEH